MPLWEAVEALAGSNIPVIVDCKHFDAWTVVEEVVRQLRPERCLVHSFVFELKFVAGRVRENPTSDANGRRLNACEPSRESFHCSPQRPARSGSRRTRWS